MPIYNIEIHLKNLFLLGRPLWGSLITASGNSEHEKILKLAQTKLAFSRNLNLAKSENKSSAALSLISVRTTASVNCQVSYNTEMVSQHLSTLFWIDEKKPTKSEKKRL